MIVVDASVIATALADDASDGDRARARLRGERLSAPSLIDLEVLSAWRRLVAGGALDEGRAALAVADLRVLRLDRIDHQQLLDRCWALRENVAPHDAVYVALAELLGIGLLTADVRLANAPGITCPVEVLS